MRGEQNRCRIYEQLGLSELADEPIRPGGLELTARAVALAGWPYGARVLDLGCGSGAALGYLMSEIGSGACGIDPSPVLLGKGRGRSVDLPMIQAYGEELPFAAASLDGVLAECSLSVAVDVDRVFKECYRVMKDGALLVIHDVYARHPEGMTGLGNLPGKCCLAGALPKEELLGKLAAHGFSVKFWEDHTKALKEFAARLIFTYGSLEAFWGCFRDPDTQEEAEEIQESVIRRHPGYFLLLACKSR
jgi:arsenite methyltransferase